jgi:hypothetical protein
MYKRLAAVFSVPAKAYCWCLAFSRGEAYANFGTPCKTPFVRASLKCLSPIVCSQAVEDDFGHAGLDMQDKETIYSSELSA